MRQETLEERPAELCWLAQCHESSHGNLFFVRKPLASETRISLAVSPAIGRVTNASHSNSYQTMGALLLCASIASGNREHLQGVISMNNGDVLNVTRSNSPAAGENLSSTIGDPTPASFDGKPRGYTVGHAVGDPLPPSLNPKRRGSTAGRGVGARSTTPPEHERQGRSPRDAHTWTRDPKPAPIRRPA